MKLKRFLLLIIAIVGAFALKTLKQDSDTARQSASEKASADAFELQRQIESAKVVRLHKPWLECAAYTGSHRECDARYWPGRVFPDQPLPGEKTPGIRWNCTLHPSRDARIPPVKECYADASEERQARYPCPKDEKVGSILARDEGCKDASLR